MGFFKTPMQKQAIYISDMIDGLGKKGRKELRKEMEIDRQDLIELREKLYRISKGELADPEELNMLQLMVEDIYEDYSDTDIDW
jgi:hypothetical protein